MKSAMGAGQSKQRELVMLRLGFAGIFEKLSDLFFGEKHGAVLFHDPTPGMV